MLVLFGLLVKNELNFRPQALASMDLLSSVFGEAVSQGE